MEGFGAQGLRCQGSGVWRSVVKSTHSRGVGVGRRRSPERVRNICRVVRRSLQELRYEVKTAKTESKILKQLSQESNAQNVLTSKIEDIADKIASDGKAGISNQDP